MFLSSFFNVASSLHPALLLVLMIALAVQVEARPSALRSDAQVLEDLFGLKIRSLVLVHPEVAEGSADGTPPFSQSDSVSGVKTPIRPPHFILGLLRSRKRLGGRSRKGVARGCFGMKVDRIGVISGLGC